MSDEPTAEDLLSRRFCAGQGFELLPFDHLDEAEQSAFAELLADPDFFGLLKPAAGRSGSVKAVNRDTALLLYTLAKAGPLPFFVRREPEAATGIVQLLLDGVLEVELAGRFVSGAEAMETLSATAPGGSHRLAQLSFEALCLAAAASDTEAPTLTGELYNFHRRPISPRWAAQLAGSEAVLAYAGLAAGSPARRRAESRWKIRHQEAQPGWIYLEQRAARSGQGAAYKLYVSPEIEDLPLVLARVLAAAQRHGVAQLKLGADAAGLLRPDKLVLYLGDLDQLLAVARELEAELAGVRAQGVPFTAPIDAAGLLSWGADPPATARPLSWQGPESWRSWLAGHLAAAIAAAGTRDPAAGARFALARLAAEGVDVERWVPTAALWKAA